MIVHTAGTRIGQWTIRPRRAIRRLSERTPLRVKLITALLALVIIALGAISVASVYVLHSYLTAQSDTELKGALSRLDTDSLISNPPGYLYPIRYQQNLFAGIQLPGSQLAWPPADMPSIGSPGQQRQSPPALPTSANWAGISPALVTVPAQSGSDTWRVIAENYSYQTVSSTGSTQQVTGTLDRRHGSRQHQRHGPPHRLLRHDRGRRYRVRPGDGGRRGGAGQPETPGRDRGDRGGHRRRPS